MQARLCYLRWACQVDVPSGQPQKEEEFENELLYCNATLS